MPSLLRCGTGLLVLACALSASAQRRRPGITGGRSIGGQILYAASNRPVQGAYVSLELQGGGTARSATTGADGRFQFESVGGGVYHVVARMAGYHRASQRVDLTMQPRGYVMFSLRAKKDSRSAQALAGQDLISVYSLAVPEKALKEFEQASEALLEKGEPKVKVAEQHLRKAIKLYPNYVQAHHLLGTLYMDRQAWEEGKKYLQQALAINPQFAPSYLALGALHNRQGQPKQAESALRRGLELAPDSWQGHSELSRTLLAQGEVEQAVFHARRAHELQPEAPLLHVVLANIFLRQRDLQAALQEYRHFLELAPDAPVASQVEAKAQQIESALKKQSLSQTPPPQDP
ncbi:MAG: tetratricopeptide repeat protein [Candidatus Acidoferrales bacterium]